MVQAQTNKRRLEEKLYIINNYGWINSNEYLRIYHKLPSTSMTHFYGSYSFMAPKRIENFMTLSLISTKGHKSFMVL